MSRPAYASWWLFGGGLTLTAVFGALIGWARFKPVQVPQPAVWAHVPSLCAGPGVRISETARLLQEHGIEVRVEPGACPGRAAIHVEVSEAQVDRLFPSEATWEAEEVRGAYERDVTLNTVLDCRAWVVDGGDTAAIVHEVLHCTGRDHPQAAPTGHVLNPDYARMGLDDWRGI